MTRPDAVGDDVLASVLQTVVDDEREQRPASFPEVAAHANVTQEEAAAAVVRLRDMELLQIMYDAQDPQYEEASRDSLSPQPSLEHLRHAVIGLRRASEQQALAWLDQHGSGGSVGSGEGEAGRTPGEEPRSRKVPLGDGDGDDTGRPSSVAMAGSAAAGSRQAADDVGQREQSEREQAEQARREQARQEQLERERAELAERQQAEQRQAEQRQAEQQQAERQQAEQQERPARLLDDREEGVFVDRWREVQRHFVDDPQRAVRDGDALVAELIQALAQRFSDQKRELEQHWSGGGEPSTEQLRRALQAYRSFFRRLLGT